MNRAEFEVSLGFALDDFQRRALDSLDADRSVVVAAPTGSGKTVVAEYAVVRALGAHAKIFYTTPIKALSNQKFADLQRIHGAAKVGLLTGDIAINERAQVVVMTTEVLRNMLYAHSPMLEGLRYVVLDEVHYLQDTFRGPVWEEVIIHTPPAVDLVCLSATVSNAEELADWVASVRGTTDVILSDVRPIELTQMHLVHDRERDELAALSLFVDGRPNTEGTRYDSGEFRAGPRQGARRRAATPRRTEIVEFLQERDLLPALYFIFSRAACDDAVAVCARAGLRLTNPDERRRIQSIVEARVAPLSTADLDVLGYQRFRGALQSGIAAHHAGMVPAFKEAVEACFVEGLVKAVFATETLALGVNMPARTVVIERLVKFNGERHELLTPGEYTQLTGRAGRRGLDPVGYAVTLWSPAVSFETVADLAGRRSFDLRSAFRPTYNMAVNLVGRSTPEAAHHVLSLSFAQYQADASLLKTNARLDRLRRSLDEAEKATRCDRGDIEDYLGRQHSKASARATEAEVLTAMERLSPGDVIEHHPDGRSHRVEPVVVVATAQRREPFVRVVTISKRALTLTPRDFVAAPTALSNVKLPDPYNPKSRKFVEQSAGALQRAVQRMARSRPEVAPTAAVEACPDFERHVRAAATRDRIRDEMARLSERAKERTESVAEQFDRVCDLLEARGYIDGWSVTARGTMLSRIYHERDLLIAEAIAGGLFDGLKPDELAGFVSVFVFQRRGPGAAADDDLPSGFPRVLRSRWTELGWIGAALESDERAFGLPLTGRPDAGFAAAAQAWASGRGLAEVLAVEDLTGGDFVRTAKALVDLLRQLALVLPDSVSASAAAAAATAVHSGVVAAGAAVTEVAS